jgi:hypothetical protein
MTEERTPEDLESIAAAIGSIPDEFAVLRALLRTIPEPTQPQLNAVRQALIDSQPGAGGLGGGLSLVSATPVGSESGGIIGISPQLFFGETNLLQDPTLDDLTSSSLTTTTSYVDCGFPWRVKHVLNSGTLPSNHLITRLYERIDLGVVDNPFNSAAGYIQVSGFGANAANLDVYLQNGSSVNFSNAPLLPYLLSSVRIQSYGGLGDATVTVYAEICDNTDALVVASVPIAFNALAAIDDVPQVVARLQDPSAGVNYRWRLRINISKPATSTANVQVVFGEPAMQQFWTGEPPPYTPQTGKWDPLVKHHGAASGIFLGSTLANDANRRYQVKADGKTEWGPGSSAVDTNLYRNAAGELKTDGILTVGGAMRQGGTSFPGSPADNDLFYRTDLDMLFFYNGTRWLSEQLFTMQMPIWAASGTWTVSISATQAAVQNANPNLGIGTDVWLEKFIWTPFIASGGTALSASHKWVADLVKLDTGNASTSVVTASLDSGASNAWRPLTASIGALLGTVASFPAMRVDITKTGTPGNLTLTSPSIVTYRIVQT